MSLDIVADDELATSLAVLVDDDAILNLRSLVAPDVRPADTAAVRIRAGALVTRLKALNRAANAATRARKLVTADARHDMDQTHLGLQNLLYEKRHLEREIEKCHQFASIYQDVPLYALEQFIELAPPEARTTDVLENEHQLMLNRLSFELAERQRLELRRKELVNQKEELIRKSKIKLSTVDSVKTQIEALVKAASDIQKKVDELIPSAPPSHANTPAPG